MRRGGAAAGIILASAVGSISAQGGGGAGTEDRRASDAAMHAMSQHGHDDANPHLQLSTLRAATPADSARAAELVAVIRRQLAKYRDVNAARADGFEQFLPNLPLPVYHFTNYRYGLAAGFGFDPARPTSLLYRKNADGSYTLTGVMYTAPQRLAEEALDPRIPLGIARWHRHVNWCLPRKGEEPRWLETGDGKPLFGPESPIATAAACEAAGGRFLPRLFGWMIHVNAFESDNPSIIWGDHR